MRQTNVISIKRRLRRLLLVCFIPLTTMLVLSLFLTMFIAVQYDKIVSNITRVNAYNISFKEDLDYIMYIVTVNSDRAPLLVDTEQPHRMISSARETFTELQKETKSAEKKRMLRGILKNLDTLERHVSQTESTANVVGMYDDNMSRLELDIRILTELIQEDIQSFISEEVRDLDELKSNLENGVRITLFLSVLLVGTILAFAITFSRRIMNNITAGIDKIQLVTRKAGKGDFSARIDVETMDEELAELGVGYNHMVQRLDALVQDIKSEQLNLRMTEQKLLQAQINPHFLYNTLDNIMWLAESGENESVIMMVSSLSDFFRTTLSKGRDYITIEEEESHIRSYLQIQQFRYQDILKYEINIPSELYHYQTLKLTLQPLVENALYHGIKNKRGMGQIKVYGRKEGDVIYLSVEDNGIGMKPERLEEVKRGMRQEQEKLNSFGLYNVLQRIRLNYGEEYGIDIDSAYGEGTIITVRIPAQEAVIEK